MNYLPDGSLDVYKRQGLFNALFLPQDYKVIVITKKEVEESDSFLAQGGISALKNPEDYDSYFEDTMKAGHYENDKGAVEKLSLIHI